MSFERVTIGDAAIYTGDALTVLRTLPAESVQCCVTSPPYYGLRDYGHDGQIGLEPTPEQYVERLLEVFREVRRVLRGDGVLWLNLGDSYSSGVCGRNDMDDASLARRAAAYGTGRGEGAGPREKANARKVPVGYKPKDLIGIPWMVAFALRADGWYLRQDVIWAKPNPMPESVRDRCTKAHEYLFMLTKSARYYYDADAIKEPAIYSGIAGMDETGFKNAANFCGKHAGESPVRGERADKQRGHSRRHAGFNDRWDAMSKEEQSAGMRNKRSVWTVATQPYAEAHFATFPPALIEPCILAGSRPGDTVLDPFNGSGTSGDVALRLGRRYVGIELNPQYVELTHRRLRGKPMALPFAMELAA